MMKKIFSLILTLILTFAICLSCFHSMAFANDSGYSPYVSIIDDLEKEYGEIESVSSDYHKPYSDCWEVDGLCLLKLLDMDNIGTKELFAVCKKANEDYYKGFVYTIEEGKAKLVFKIDESTCMTNGGFNNIIMTHSDGKDRIVCTPTMDDANETLYGFIDGKYQTVEYKCDLSYTSDRSKDTYYINDKKVDGETYSNSRQEHGISDLYSSEKNTILYVRVLNEDYLDYERLIDIISKTKAIIHGESDSEESLNADSKSETWRLSYIKYMERDPDLSTMSDSCDCGLIYLDNDDIPELIIQYGTWALGTKIVSYKNGELFSRSFSGEYGISYIERKGLVHNSETHMGTRVDDFASLDKDGFHDLGFGIRNSETETSANYIEFQWNGEDVTEEEFNKNYESVFDESQAKRWNANDDVSPDNVYSAASMLNHLREYSSSQEEKKSDSIQEPVTDKFTMEEFGISYGHYTGGKSQGDGVFGLDMDLYEDLTFSIQSSFDLFSDEDGDEYDYSGTYRVDRVNDNGNPVLLLHCDKGDFELEWDGEQLSNETFFAWYED